MRDAGADSSARMSIPAQFAAAFNRRDVDGLVALFTERATYHDLFYGEHSHHAGIRAMFERMFREGRDHVWTMDRVLDSPRDAVAEWTFGFVVSEAVPRSAGRKLRFRGVSIFELQDGKIGAYREYFDRGTALVQLGLGPEALAKVLRR